MSTRESIEKMVKESRAEDGSSTPDGVLADYLAEVLEAFDKASRSRDHPPSARAQYLVDVLEAFDRATRARDAWHGFVARSPQLVRHDLEMAKLPHSPMCVCPDCSSG